MGEMTVVVRPRQGGKTTEAIRLAAEGFLYIVCPNREMADWTARKARELGLDIPHPVTWDEFTRHRYFGSGVNGFVVDNLDLCVQSMTPVPVRAVTLTGNVAS